MNRVGGALKIRPGEGRVVATVAAAFAAVEAGRGLGEVGVQALVLDSAGAAILPPLYIALGLVGLVATLSYGALIAAFNVAHSRFIWQDLTAGRAATDLALEKYREVGDEVGIARVEFSFSVMTLESQSAELPRASLIELTRRFRDLSDPAYESMASFGLAWVAIREGNVREASAWGLRAMLLERPLHDVASMTIALQESGAVLLELGDAEGAATVLGAFGSLSDRYGVRAPLAFERILGVNTTNERITGQLGSDRAAEAARRGRVMTLDEIFTYLVERLDALGIEPAEV